MRTGRLFLHTADGLVDFGVLPLPEGAYSPADLSFTLSYGPTIPHASVMFEIESMAFIDLGTIEFPEPEGA